MTLRKGSKAKASQEKDPAILSPFLIDCIISVRHSYINDKNNSLTIEIWENMSTVA